MPEHVRCILSRPSGERVLNRVHSFLQELDTDNRFPAMGTEDMKAKRTSCSEGPFFLHSYLPPPKSGKRASAVTIRRGECFHVPRDSLFARPWFPNASDIHTVHNVFESLVVTPHGLASLRLVAH